MKKIIALMLALGLAVPVNAVNRRSARRYLPVKRVAKAKNYGDMIAVAMFIAGAIITSLGSYLDRRYGTRRELEQITDTSFEPAFPELAQTGRVYTDEPVDYYPQPHRDLDPQAEEAGWSSSSDDDDVSDGMAAPEYH
jgi:hypothetical protein